MSLARIYPNLSLVFFFFTPAGGLLYLSLTSVMDQSKNCPYLKNQQETARYFQSTVFPMLSHSSDSKVP